MPYYAYTHNEQNHEYVLLSGLLRKDWADRAVLVLLGYDKDHFGRPKVVQMFGYSDK